MAKIRVLHMIKTLGLGGAEVNLFNLVNAIDQRRFEIHVAYSAGGEIEERFRRFGIRLFKYADEPHRLKSLASLGIVLRIAAYILRNKIQIVHTHTFNAQVWGGLAARLTGCKVIEHVHDFRYFSPADFHRRRGFSHQYQYVKYFKHFADRVVVLTKQNVEFLLSETIQPSEKIREFKNGIPIPKQVGKNEQIYHEILKQYQLPNNALLILTPIRLAPEKNVDLIGRIAPEVIRAVPQAYFLIAGDGPLMGQTALDLKLAKLTNHVRLIGFHQNIHNLLKAADLLLLPSFLELHSIAILEAMSMKVPVVVSDGVGCHNEFIVHGQNGVLVDPFSDQGWAEALIDLLKDKKKRQAMGEAGFATCVAQFNIEKTILKFEHLYDEVAQT